MLFGSELCVPEVKFCFLEAKLNFPDASFGPQEAKRRLPRVVVCLREAAFRFREAAVRFREAAFRFWEASARSLASSLSLSVFFVSLSCSSSPRALNPEDYSTLRLGCLLITALLEK